MLLRGLKKKLFLQSSGWEICGLQVGHDEKIVVRHGKPKKPHNEARSSSDRHWIAEISNRPIRRTKSITITNDCELRMCLIDSAKKFSILPPKCPLSLYCNYRTIQSISRGFYKYTPFRRQKCKTNFRFFSVEADSNNLFTVYHSLFHFIQKNWQKRQGNG